MKRKSGVDFLKFICAFMVVCIHLQFPEPVSTIITPIIQISVPIFFVITGYFYSMTKEKNSELKQIKKIGIAILYGNGIYFLYAISMHILKNKTLAGFFGKFFNKDALLKFVFLNESPFAEHLWYLGAIFYVLIIVLLVDKIHSRKILYPLIPFLLLTDLVFGKYSLLIFGREFPYIFVRNFLFLGLPYFLIGDLLFKNKEKLKYYPLRLSGFTALFLATSYFERYTLGMFDLNASRDHYISTTFLLVTVFLLFLNLEKTKENRLYRGCCFIGSKLSLNIYILHPLFIIILSKITPKLCINSVAEGIVTYTFPIVIFVVSIVASWVLNIAFEKIKKHPVKN